MKKINKFIKMLMLLTAITITAGFISCNKQDEPANEKPPVEQGGGNGNGNGLVPKDPSQGFPKKCFHCVFSFLNYFYAQAVLSLIPSRISMNCGFPFA